MSIISMGKPEYKLLFCRHGNKLCRHYDAIGQKNSDLKQLKKDIFRTIFCCSINVHILIGGFAKYESI